MTCDLHRPSAAAETRLEEAAEQWSDYERRHRELSGWCGEHEQLFSQLQLKATLSEKVSCAVRRTPRQAPGSGQQSDTWSISCS